MKLDTKKDGDVKNLQAFKHIDRFFKTNQHNITLKKGEQLHMMNHILPGPYLHRPNRSIDTKLVNQSLKAPAQQRGPPQPPQYITTDPHSLLNSPMHAHNNAFHGAFPPACRQSSVMSAGQVAGESYPARMRSNMAISAQSQQYSSIQPTLGIEGHSYSDKYQRPIGMIISPLPKAVEPNNHIYEQAEIVTPRKSQLEPEILKVNKLVIDTSNPQNEHISRQNGLRITESQIRSKMGKQNDRLIVEEKN